MDIDDFISDMTEAAAKAALFVDPAKTHIQMVYLNRPETPDDTPETAPTQVVQGVSLAAIKEMTAEGREQFVAALIKGVTDHHESVLIETLRRDNAAKDAEIAALKAAQSGKKASGIART